MERVRILVVEDDSQQRESVVEYLREQPDIQVVGEAEEGSAALRLMEREQPDIILLDMVMQGMDGWETLRQMQARGMDCGKVIVMTSFGAQHYISLAAQFGVGSFMLKPFYELSGLHRRILDVALGFVVPEAEPPAAERPPPPVQDAAVEDVGGALLTIGVPARVKGFLYLREAVRLVAEEPQLLSKRTLALYPDIARRYGTTPENAERAMRHAIKLGWARTSQEKLDMVFGAGVCSPEDRPSIGELIALLVNAQKKKRERD